MKSSLGAAQVLHQAHLYKTQPSEAVFQYIRENIRTHQPDHLSAMIYYTALLSQFDKEIWELYEMQISRTNITKAMSVASIVRTAEGFARKPGDFFEVFNTLEFNLVKNLENQEVHVEEVYRAMYCFASLNQGGKEFWQRTSEKVFDGKNEIAIENAAKVLWSLSAMQIRGELTEWLVKRVHGNCKGLSPYWKRQVDWAVCNIK